MICLEKFELNESSEWEKYLNTFCDYLEETCGADDYVEEREIILSDEYKKHILAVVNRETNPLHIVKILQDNAYIGYIDYICYVDENGKGSIGNFYIYPTYRNQGIGAEVYDRIENDIKMLGGTYVELTPEELAVRFYERKGFYFTGVISEENNLKVYRKEL